MPITMSGRDVIIAIWLVTLAVKKKVWRSRTMEKFLLLAIKKISMGKTNSRKNFATPFNRLFGHVTSLAVFGHGTRKKDTSKNWADKIASHLRIMFTKNNG